MVDREVAPLDPSPRTSEQLVQAIAGLKELIFARMEENDKAVVRLQEFANSQPTPGVIFAKLQSLGEMVDMRFNELEKRSEQSRIADKGSLDIALTAAKEATTKSETSFTKQVDAIGVQIGESRNAFEVRINDLKERIDRNEGIGAGSKDSNALTRTIMTIGMTAIMVAVGVASLILSRA